MLVTGKYIVYKKDPAKQLIELSEETFFVLKDLDVLGVITLRLYVAAALQILDSGRNPTTGLHLTEKEKEDLMLRVDGASSLADKWAGRPKHIPD